MSVLAMKGGAVEFLTKPVRNQDLLDVVQLAIGRDTTRRDAPTSLETTNDPAARRSRD